MWSKRGCVATPKPPKTAKNVKTVNGLEGCGAMPVFQESCLLLLGLKGTAKTVKTTPRPHPPLFRHLDDRMWRSVFWCGKTHRENAHSKSANFEGRHSGGHLLGRLLLFTSESLPKPKAEPEPPEPLSRNRNRNRHRPFLLNCTENTQKNLFCRGFPGTENRNRSNRSTPEP